jgi:drug/metabolite transporter (DMT)-like permease
LTPLSSARAETPARTALIAAFAVIYLFWGGTFLALRYAVAEVPPLLTIATRCLGGALFLYAWLALGKSLVPTTRAQWLTATIAGGFLFVGCHGVMAWAEQRVSSGQAALFLTTIPVWLVLLSSWRESRRPPRLVVGGIALGILGVALLTLGKSAGGESMGDRLALIGSGLSWAAGSLIARDGSRPQSVAQATAMQLLCGGIAVLLLSGLTGELAGWSVAQVTGRGALSLAFLVLGGTVLGFGAYTWLLQVAQPAAVGTYAFVNPVVALALAWAVGDEPFSGRTVLAGVIVLAGVVLIWKSSGSAGRSPRSEGPARAGRSFAAFRATGIGLTALLTPRANRG